MASTYLPLQQLFKLTSSAKRLEIFDLLQLGEIKAVSSEWVKANLYICYTEENLASAIQRLPYGNEIRSHAFSQAKTQKEIYRIWMEGDYYTIKESDRGFDVFSYRDYRQVFPETEMHPEFWELAWIDEDRWVVLCDDLTNLLRREFGKVGLLRNDIQRYLAPDQHAKRKPSGRPKEHFVQNNAYAVAHRALRQSPGISQTRWAQLVLDAIDGPKPERTVFLELYGPIYTEHRKLRKSEY